MPTVRQLKEQIANVKPGVCKPFKNMKKAELTAYLEQLQGKSAPKASGAPKAKSAPKASKVKKVKKVKRVPPPLPPKEKKEKGVAANKKKILLSNMRNFLKKYSEESLKKLIVGDINMQKAMIIDLVEDVKEDVQEIEEDMIELKEQDNKLKQKYEKLRNDFPNIVRRVSTISDASESKKEKTIKVKILKKEMPKLSELKAQQPIKKQGFIKTPKGLQPHKFEKFLKSAPPKVKKTKVKKSKPNKIINFFNEVKKDSQKLKPYAALSDNSSHPEIKYYDEGALYDEDEDFEGWTHGYNIHSEESQAEYNLYSKWLKNVKTTNGSYIKFLEKWQKKIKEIKEEFKTGDIADAITEEIIKNPKMSSSKHANEVFLYLVVDLVNVDDSDFKKLINLLKHYKSNKSGYGTWKKIK